MRKPTKTISGVTPLAVVIKPRKCPHGTCLYCPTLAVPQSYTPKSPAIMCAMLLNYDPHKQTLARLKAFQAMKHPTDKIELIIMGGTFPAYPKNYQYNFIKACYDAFNGKISKTLEQAKKLNEKAEHRCVALCIETRPDFCSKKDIEKMLEFGCTRVELGVQAPDDKIYKKVCRGHTVRDVIEATRRLKNAGFKIGYHIMPGLPGSNFKKDIRMFRELFLNSDFKPDQLKIYPTQVIKGAELERLYERGKYKPYTKEQLIKLIIEFKQIVPRYCRIMRVMREIPPDFLVAGTIRIDLRKVIHDKMEVLGLKCNCIRCREIGFALLKKKEIKKDLKLNKIEYKASKGKELFIEIINKDDIIFGLIRLRIPDKSEILLVRELHVYGPALKIGKRARGKAQHTGLGKWLMDEAEKIASEYSYKKIFIISGVGVREYYRKLGYKLEGHYMVKYLS
ncbi:MAG: tRNA uridine(34) 5-carboxymethylaminomethyl modification radical SAM/GNAT enzyme Elp3 [Candidatus Pacearchaeota archaeon]|nr:MAG: tRNA uridine(34) 5-carboxymethylaminomethyl modification radical SAM/GNAT enzyme Elp3 [Candidatus Pacearchaeota archaeon]